MRDAGAASEPAKAAGQERHGVLGNRTKGAETINHTQLTDLRALQRTFDGAYTRTALAQLSYAIVILRLFDREFYWCGLVYTVLAAQLICIAIYRYNLAMSNKDRWTTIQMDDLQGHSSAVEVQGRGDDHITVPRPASIFRRSFRTAGDVVAIATISTLAMEVALVVLVMRM